MNNFLLIALAIGVASVVLSGCASVVYSTKNLPANYKSTVGDKFQIEPFDPLLTNIGKVYADEMNAHEGLSGAMLITNGTFALLHRVALARMAQHTIELQTYIYENDFTSRLLMAELKHAADRGVKVRIIVDDNGLDSDHSDIMTLGYHPNIEVKVFNPFKYRAKILRYPQLVFNISRMNYRMHNKMFAVDRAAVILGGRNVAGNYFDSNTVKNFSDTDVLFVGKIAYDAVDSFDEYWDFHMSIPVSVFPEQNDPERLNDADEEIEDLKNNKPYEYELYQTVIGEFIRYYNDKYYDIYWGEGGIIADPPSKAEGSGERSPITSALEHLWNMSKKSIYISSAYLIPGKLGAESMIKSAENGVKLSILTNSLSSTDAIVVYSGWRKYRDELVKNGVNVYEFRNEGYKVRNQMSSGASLHSKVMVVDDEITWVGSFNFDPRSAAINTEVVAAFYSPEFAVKMRESIEMDMSEDHSWHVVLEDYKILWKTSRNGKEEVFDHCPDTSFGSRMLMILMTVAPESMM